MKEPRKPAETAKSDIQPSARRDAANGSGKIEPLLSSAAIDALGDITKRTDRLTRRNAEKLMADDGYQVIDSRTVVNAFLGVAHKAQADPARFLQEQSKLWLDMAQLW